MPLEDEFGQAVKEWRTHCERSRFQSLDRAYLECDAYRRIIAMGPPVLPLIKGELIMSKDARDVTGDPRHLWTYAIKEICPDFALDTREISGGGWVQPTERGFIGLDPIKTIDAAVRWLDGNMGRYVSTTESPQR